MTLTDFTSPDALFLGDNLALDFINSRYGVGDQRHDCFSDDQSVLNWLKTAQVVSEQETKAPQGLLTLARALREAAGAVVSAAMSGIPADPDVINQVLEAGRPLRRLEWHPQDQAFRMVAHQRDAHPASLLEPVAESLASLVTSNRFHLVRQCEAHDCVLLFHDLTKSHRRRWCSMATCGNRMKVAAYRSRNKNT